MNRTRRGVVPCGLALAMLLFGVRTVHGQQTAGQVPKFDSSLTVIKQDPSGNIGIGTTAAPASRQIPLMNGQTSLPRSTMQEVVVQVWDSAVRGTPVIGEAYTDRCVDPNRNISVALGLPTLSRLDHAVFVSASNQILDVADETGTSVLAGLQGPLVVHDSTLAGDGSSDSPLGLALPLDVSADATTDSTAVLTVTNTNTAGNAIKGVSSGFGVVGDGQLGGLGVFGISVNGYGVYGTSSTSAGMFGSSPYGPGVYGQSGNVGVYAQNLDSHHDAYLASGCCAGDFYGDVYVHGTLTKTGGSFKIDHPLDPANKYLSHSFVESPDMKNIYDGIAVLDKHGEVVVQLPDWFEALNHDFRYQLTAIGAPAPRLYIAKEIRDGRFTIAGGKAGTKISWQVTGTRHDAWADANRILTEEDKPAAERGYYLHPEVFGKPADLSIGRALHQQNAVARKQ